MCISWNDEPQITHSNQKPKRNRTVVRAGQKWVTSWGTTIKVISTTQNNVTVKYEDGEKETLQKFELKSYATLQS